MKRDQSKSSHDGSKDRYRVLVETIPYGVEEIDTTGAIIFCNPACSNMLGFSSEELCGMKVWDLSTTDAEISKLESKFSAVLSGRQVPSPYSTFRRTADGRAIEVHVDWAYLRDDAGKIAGFTSIVSDITERRRVEQALMESEERFRGLAEASFGAVVIVEGSRIVDFSDKALDIYGYDSSELLGKEVYTLMAPEQRAGLKERIARCQTDPTESVNVSRSGKRFPVEVSGAMFSHEGRQRIVFAVRDITERKRAERELSRQALIWTQLADAVLVMDPDGVIVDANLGAEHLFGYSKAELQGRFGSTLHPEDTRGSFRRSIAEALRRDGRWTGETTAIRKDGVELIVDLRVMPFEDEFGDVVGQVAVNRDVTARKRAEQALRDAEERVSTILENVAEGVIAIDEGGVVSLYNAAAATTFGYSPEEVLGRKVAMLMSDSDRHQHDHYLSNYIETGNRKIIGIGQTVTGRRKDGSLFPMNLEVGECRASGRRMFIGTVRDLTERLRLEDELRQSVERAEQANAAKTRFLAAASHDVRQPLQAINLFNYTLSKKATDPAIKELTGNIATAVGTMNSVIDALLDISKLEAGAIMPAVADFAIDPMLERVCGELQMDVAIKGLELRVVPSAAIVRSDRDLLERVVQNFVLNAVRYTPRGRLLVGCRRRGRNLQIQVWDTGPGIPDDQLERIFEEFYQLDNSARDRGKGLGLGLAIVDRVAGLLDHSIEVRSVLGKGSMFSVLVPLGDEISARASEKESEVSIASGAGLTGRTILIVEDDPKVAEATRHLLEHWGARVFLAGDAKHAVELVADDGSRPDLIIADYRLSDTATGIDVLREITNLLDAELPRIILSGDMSSQLHDEALSLGVPLLHKPVQPAKLRALIHHVMHAPA